MGVGRLRESTICGLVTFLGAFTQLRKATISFVISVRPCVLPHGTTGVPLTNFHEILHLRNFRKSVKKMQVSLTLKTLN